MLPLSSDDHVAYTVINVRDGTAYADTVICTLSATTVTPKAGNTTIVVIPSRRTIDTGSDRATGRQSVARWELWCRTVCRQCPHIPIARTSSPFTASDGSYSTGPDIGAMDRTGVTADTVGK